MDRRVEGPLPRGPIRDLFNRASYNISLQHRLFGTLATTLHVYATKYLTTFESLPQSPLYVKSQEREPGTNKTEVIEYAPSDMGRRRTSTQFCWQLTAIHKAQTF